MGLRENIIAAAVQVIRTKGLAKTTTKEVAREAGCSEGSLYNHFESKEDLFFHTLKGQLPNIMFVSGSLLQRKGTRTVSENLAELMLAALTDFTMAMPLMASIFSEPGLLSRHREGFRQRNEGPHRPNEVLEEYLREELILGRVRSDIDARAAADMILGSCFQRAFQLQFLGISQSEEDQFRYAEGILRTLGLSLARTEDG